MSCATEEVFLLVPATSRQLAAEALACELELLAQEPSRGRIVGSNGGRREYHGHSTYMVLYVPIMGVHYSKYSYLFWEWNGQSHCGYTTKPITDGDAV